MTCVSIDGKRMRFNALVTLRMMRLCVNECVRMSVYVEVITYIHKFVYMIVEYHVYMTSHT